MNNIVFNCDTNIILRDMKKTKNPIKMTILRRLLEIKETQDKNRMIPVNVVQSSYTETDLPSNKSSNLTDNLAETTLNTILKQQQDGLIKLTNIKKSTNTQNESIDENDSDNDNHNDNHNDNGIHNTDTIKQNYGRGENEDMWSSKLIYDPKYAKYQENDVMNNRLMERLNSEITFRTDGIENSFHENEQEYTTNLAKKSQKKN